MDSADQRLPGSSLGPCRQFKFVDGIVDGRGSLMGPVYCYESCSCRGDGAVAKTLKTKVKQVAKTGAQGVSSVAGEALGAAAVTAAGVVLERVAQALGSGAKKVEKGKPAVQRAAKKAVSPAGRKRKAKKSRKAPRRKKTTATKKRRR